MNLKRLDTFIKFESKDSSIEPNAYIHLILREKYFLLIQSIIEINNELVVKFVFNCLQKYCQAESECAICSLREKSQLILNILRFIQHTEISNEVIKLEIFKFFLSNYDVIEIWLNAKIFNSIIEVARLSELNLKIYLKIISISS